MCFKWELHARKCMLAMPKEGRESVSMTWRAVYSWNPMSPFMNSCPAHAGSASCEAAQRLASVLLHELSSPHEAAAGPKKVDVFAAYSSIVAFMQWPAGGE